MAQPGLVSVPKLAGQKSSVRPGQPSNSHKSWYSLGDVVDQHLVCGEKRALVYTAFSEGTLPTAALLCAPAASDMLSIIFPSLFTLVSSNKKI